MWMMEWRVISAVCDICGFDRLGKKSKTQGNELTICQLDSVTFSYFLPYYMTKSKAYDASRGDAGW